MTIPKMLSQIIARVLAPFSLSRGLSTFILLSAAGTGCARAGGSAAPADLDQYVNRGLKEWKIPGIAVGIVKDDKVVYLKGFGVREVGKPDPITPETDFAIGSTSKAFTAALVAMLVDDGKLAWDDPVQKYLPNFELSEDFPSRDLRVKDLLANRSGLDATSEFLWYGSPFTRAEIIARLARVPLTDGFRYQFGYRNTMFLTAGQLAGKAAGNSWEGLLQTRVFQPLGMTRSFPTQAAIPSLKNVATPHVPDWKYNLPIPVPFRDMTNIAPAGAIISCVKDMTQWVRLQLSDGTVDGKQLLSPEALQTMHTGVTPLTSHGTLPDVDLVSYCLAWVTQEYRGQHIVWHNGNIDGMSAYVGLAPDQKLGVVILCNFDSGEFRTALFYHILDAYFGFPKNDLSPALRAKWIQDRKQTLVDFKAELRQAAKAGPQPLPAGKYAGNYTNPIVGNAKISLEGNTLIFHRYTDMTMALIPASATVSGAFYLEKRYELRDPPEIVKFHLTNGAVDSFEISGLEYTRSK